MKKYLIITVSILCILISACSGNEYKGINRGTITGESLQLEENNPYDGLTEPDWEITDELAIDIGNAVIKSVYGQDVINKSEYSLKYIKNDEVYLFTRVPNSVKGGFGMDYEVAIRKKDGAILRVWIGE